MQQMEKNPFAQNKDWKNENTRWFFCKLCLFTVSKFKKHNLVNV